MGGSSAGTVSYPTYMQEVHGSFLNHQGDDTVTASMVDTFNSAIGNSPFSGATTFDPSDELTTMYDYITLMQENLSTFNHLQDYENAMRRAEDEVDRMLDSAHLNSPIPSINLFSDDISDDIASFRAQQLDNLEAEVLPKFRAGMLDINAVQSSSFIIGEAILRAFNERDVARYASEIRVRLLTQNNESNARLLGQREEIISRHFLQRNEMVKTTANDILMGLYKKQEIWNEVSRLTIEAKRLHIIAKKEQIAEQFELDESDARWDLDLYQPLSNMLAGIAGGGMPVQKKANKAVSALGGAISGAAAGSAINVPYGTIVGAVAGAALGYFGAS